MCLVYFLRRSIMKKFTWFLTLVLALFFAVSCGGSSKKEEEETPDTDEISDEEPAETDGDAEKPADDSDNTPSETPEVDPLKCEDFADGINENLIVGEGKNELARSFILRLPENVESAEKLPVIFLYHGYGDSASNFENFLSGMVNNETMPFILVVPESRGDIYGFNNIPPAGLEWDMMNLTDGSAEGDMFDAILECLEKRWNIDEKHIHVSGFSAGAITANSIGLQKPEKIASILSYSGAYFSDEKSRDALGDLMGMKIGDFFTWPDFAEKHNKYPQVFVYGDKENDSWGMSGIFTIYFNQMARLGAGYLSGLGHDAILCDHGQTHTVAGISEEGLIKFFADHPFGTTASPYKDEMPAEFAEICHFFTEEDLIEDEEEPEEPETPDGEPLTCADFKEGYNKNLMVGEGSDTLARNFYLRMPADADGQLPVVFFYHPYNVSASDIDSVLSGSVNNDTMPLILVIPEARSDKFKLGLPPTGLDWDIVTLSDGNAEADMFDAILECLKSRDMVDEERIHISGFSAGAIAADSVALMRSDKVASVLTYSGAYFSDPANREALGTVEISEGNQIPIGSFFTWPDFEEEHNKYTQMFMFGDAGSDTWSVEDGLIDFTIDFNETAQNDGDYLLENGHGAILCNHGGGHNPQTSQSDIDALVKFFYDHPLGTNPSPYKNKMPQEFSNCVFKK